MSDNKLVKTSTELTTLASEEAVEFVIGFVIALSLGEEIIKFVNKPQLNLEPETETKPEPR